MCTSMAGAVFRVVQCVVMLCLLSATCRSSNSSRRLSEHALVVRELFDLLEVMQVKQDRPFISPGLWQEDKGLYPSFVRLNFVGAPEVSALRELISVFDNNMFASAWITSALLEAHYYGAAPRPSDQQVVMALDAIAQHRDRNVNHTTSVMAFWPQAYDVNTTLWVSTPANLLDAFQVFDQLPWDNIDKFLEKLGLKDVENFLHNIKNSRLVAVVLVLTGG